MEIWYLGHSSFRIRTSRGIIVTDPYGPEIGFKLPKIRADIVTVSHDHPHHNRSDLITDHPFVIRAPGEYEIRGISIFGVPSSPKNDDRKNTIYLIEVEGIKLCHLGDLSHDLEKDVLNQINSPDVLFVPVGGHHLLGPKEAIKVIHQIEPKITIPMHYQDKGLTKELSSKLLGIEEFLKALDIKVAPVPKLILKKADLMFEGEKVVVLERRK